MRSPIGLSTLLPAIGFAMVIPCLAAASDLVAANARIEVSEGDTPATLYLVIQNRGEEARKIVGGNCTGCSSVEIRIAVLEDGAMVPSVLPEFEIPAGGAVAFAPRGLSIALIGLSDVVSNDEVAVELEFADGEKLVVDAVVGD
jgi:copper(I)-binding protein